MKNKFLKTLSLLILLLSLGCEYEFSDDVFNKITVKNPEYQLTISNFTDNEIIRNTKTIRFSYSSNTNNRLYSILFYIDEQPLNNYGSQTEGDILLNLDNLEDGEHRIKVDLTLKSESGSIADSYGIETFNFTENFNFTVDKSVDIIEVSNVVHADGSIYISWTPPINLESYQDINLIINESYRTTRIPLLGNDSIIKNGVFRDSLSLKFNIKYKIEVTNAHVTKESNVNNFYVVDSIVSIEHEFIDKNSYKVKWNRHPLYNNFDNYKLNYNNTEEVINNQGGEKIINSQFIFGYQQYYSVALERETYIPDNTPHYGTLNYGIEYDNNDYYNLIFDKNLNCFFASKVDDNYSVEVLRLNASDLSILQKVKFSAEFSSNQSPDILLNSEGNLILDFKEKSLVLNTNNLSIIDEYSIYDYDSNLLESSTKTRYRNGLLIIDNDYDFRNIYVFNASTKQLIKTLSKEFSSVITGSSDYFTVERDLYKIKDENISKIYSSNSSLPRFYGIEFIPSLNSLVLLMGGYNGGNGLESILLNLSNNTASSIPGTEQTTYFNYDSITNSILFLNRQSSGNSTANLYDVNTETMKSIDVAGNGFGRKYVFLNDYLLLLNHNYYLENPF
jgi:hypothetical protein